MRPVRARQIEGSPRDPVSPVLGLIGDPLLWLLCILIRDNVKERRILSIDDGGAPVLVVIGALAIEQGLIKTKCVERSHLRGHNDWDPRQEEPHSSSPHRWRYANHNRVLGPLRRPIVHLDQPLVLPTYWPYR
jgi:hypothetical protein